MRTPIVCGRRAAGAVVRVAEGTRRGGVGDEGRAHEALSVFERGVQCRREDGDAVRGFPPSCTTGRKRESARKVRQNLSRREGGLEVSTVPPWVGSAHGFVSAPLPETENIVIWRKNVKSPEPPKLFCT